MTVQFEHCEIGLHCGTQDCDVEFSVYPDKHSVQIFGVPSEHYAHNGAAHVKHFPSFALSEYGEWQLSHLPLELQVLQGYAHSTHTLLMRLNPG